MATLILVAADGAAQRHWTLGPGRTAVGGPGADVVLPGVDAGALHLWGDEARLARPAGAAEVRVDGRAVEQCPLADGARIQWAGLALEFRSGAGPEREAQLTALEPAASAVPRAWTRLKAGLAVELGRADKGAARRWQAAVVEGRFDPDAAAAELLAAAPLADDDPALGERSARLFRDLLMAPTLRGARGAARGVRRATRNLVAYLVTQLVVLLFFALLFAAGLLLARYQGLAIDPLLDGLLGRG
jgi:hypothetical protein